MLRVVYAPDVHIDLSTDYKAACLLQQNRFCCRSWLFFSFLKSLSFTPTKLVSALDCQAVANLLLIGWLFITTSLTEPVSPMFQPIRRGRSIVLFFNAFLVFLILFLIFFHCIHFFSLLERSLVFVQHGQVIRKLHFSGSRHRESPHGLACLCAPAYATIAGSSLSMIRC